MWEKPSGKKPSCHVFKKLSATVVEAHRCRVVQQVSYIVQKLARMSWNTSRGREGPKGDHGRVLRCCWITAKLECGLVLPLGC